MQVFFLNLLFKKNSQTLGKSQEQYNEHQYILQGDQGSANFFSNGTHRKYFWLCRPYIQSLWHRLKSAIKYVSRSTCEQMRVAPFQCDFIHGHNFHIINYSSFDFFQRVVVKDVKTVLSSELVQNQSGGRVWPTWVSLANPESQVLSSGLNLPEGEPEICQRFSQPEQSHCPSEE